MRRPPPLPADSDAEPVSVPHRSNQDAIDLFVRRLCAHSPLDARESAAIRALPAKTVEIGAHTDFVRLGETVDHACLVADGLVGRFGQTEDGRRQFVSVHIPGEMIDLPSLMMPHATTALNALAASRVVRIAHDDLRGLGGRHRAIAAALWRDCVLDARIVAQWLINVGRRDARARIAHFLCELGVRYRMMGQSDGLRYPLRMTQEQLGDALGLTAVHINRTLMSLKADGLVSIDRNEVRILDEAALIRASEFDAAYLGVAGTA